MTAISDLLSDADRRRLLERVRQLEELAMLVREVPEQRPPEPPPILAAMSATTTTTEGTAP